jgi:hypothetical protein
MTWLYVVMAVAALAGMGAATVVAYGWRWWRARRAQPALPQEAAPDGEAGAWQHDLERLHRRLDELSGAIGELATRQDVARLERAWMAKAEATAQPAPVVREAPKAPPEPARPAIRLKIPKAAPPAKSEPGPAPAPPPPEAPTLPVDAVILQNFDRIDMLTRRSFPAFRQEFLRVLSPRVTELEEQDEAVMFRTDRDEVWVVPWTNLRLAQRWEFAFEASAPFNQPIRKVRRAALVRCPEEGGRVVIRKGEIDNA